MKIEDVKIGKWYWTFRDNEGYFLADNPIPDIKDQVVKVAISKIKWDKCQDENNNIFYEINPFGCLVRMFDSDIDSPVNIENLYETREEAVEALKMSWQERSKNLMKWSRRLR